MLAKEKKHVAIVVDSIVPGGGVNNVALAQAKALSDYFSITLVCAHGSIDHAEIKMEKVREPKLFWLKRIGHSARALILSRRFSKALALLDNRKSIDFVLCHSHLHACTARNQLRQDLPLGLVIHGDIFTRPKGTYDSLLTKLYKHSSLKAYKTADLIIALSPYMREKAIGYGARKANTVTIPNGVNSLDSPKIRPPRSRDSKFRLLFIGRLSTEKDPLTLLKALMATDKQVHLTIAGSGPLKKTILDFVHTQSLSSRVDLIGHVTSDVLSTLYTQSHALCIPSISDPLPTVVIEAMHAGLPVIGTDVEGIPYMVEHEKTGLIVPPKQPELLALAITKLFDSAELCLNFEHASKQRALQMFSLSAVTRQLSNRINQAIIKNN